MGGAHGKALKIFVTSLEGSDQLEDQNVDGKKERKTFLMLNFKHHAIKTHVGVDV
jgi:hypothetical protein